MNQSTQEINLQVLRSIEQKPDITQRKLAEEIGVSLGKINYCMKALINKGLVKAKNFNNNSNKRAYLYLLTPSGVEEKAKITLNFLQLKKIEYEQLESEIRKLQEEVNENHNHVLQG